MRNILRFLKGSEPIVIGIVIILIVQAYCDLSLPKYTSDIINVGFQQNGIESPVPETIRQSSLDDLYVFMTDDEITIVEGSFGVADPNGIRSLKKDVDISKVESVLLLPESIVYQLQNVPEMGISLQDVKMALASGAMTREQLRGQINSMLAEYEELDANYLNQIAVSYVSQEYSAQGIDLSKIQNKYLFKIGGMMLLVTLVMSIAAILTRLLAARTSAGIGRRIREELYTKVMKFTSSEMEKFSTASLITRSTNDIQLVQMVTVLLLTMVSYAPILAIFGIIRVVQTGAGMGWIVVVGVAALSALVGILVAVAMPKFKIMQTLIDKLNLVSREILSGIMPIRAFHREKYEEDRFEEANTNLYKTQLFTNRTMTFMFPIMMIIMNGLSVLIVWVGAGKVDVGTIQVGDLTAFVTYAMVIVMSFFMLTMISVMLPRAVVAADRIADVMNSKIAISDPDDPQDDKIKDCKGRLVFDHVDFAYPDALSNAVDDISFTAEPGKVTAIIGSTGCGKTTLINLIPRFFDVTGGQITLDGVDIRDLTQKTLRDQIGYVPQKSMLFSGTVESNIKYASDEVTDADIKEALSIAQAEDFVNAMPQGIESPISQKGANVSGGQSQRLSIARAIARHPKIYLFDDAFSALDYKTDVKLRTELKKYTGDSTVIIVAQRIATILHADKIICMDEGKIVGEGTHQHLLKTCKTYREIAESQLSVAELDMAGGAS